MIEFANVTKEFPTARAPIEDFDLIIPSRKTTVFVGSSGCGKTTLLRMINRMAGAPPAVTSRSTVRASSRRMP